MMRVFARYISCLKRLARDASGVAAVEFALVLPVLMLLYLGSVEVARYVLINHKVEKATSTVADVVSQAESMQTADLQVLLGAIQDFMVPYTFGANGRVIVTSVSQDADPVTNAARVRWQYCGGGTLTGVASQVGSVGGNAALPTGLSLRQGEDILIAEIYYRFAPLVGSQIIPPTTLHKIAYFRPRLGALSTYTSTCT